MYAQQNSNRLITVTASASELQCFALLLNQAVLDPRSSSNTPVLVCRKAQVTSTDHHSWPFSWVVRTELRAPGVCNQHSTSRAVTPASSLLFVTRADPDKADPYSYLSAELYSKPAMSGPLPGCFSSAGAGQCPPAGLRKLRFHSMAVHRGAGCEGGGSAEPGTISRKQPRSRERRWSSLDHCLIKAKTRCINNMPSEGRWGFDAYSMKRKTCTQYTYTWIHKRWKDSQKMERD